MKPLGNYASNIVAAMELSESPIEMLLLARMVRDPRFTIVKEGEPTGEGIFVFPTIMDSQ